MVSYSSQKWVLRMNESNYKRAESFLPWNLCEHVYNSSIFPYWTEWFLYYFRGGKSGYTLIQVNLKTGCRAEKVTMQKLLDDLSRYLQCDINENAFRLDQFYVSEEPPKLWFDYNGSCWSYNLESGLFCIEGEVEKGVSVSPDKCKGLSLEDHNLILSDYVNNSNRILTDDGVPYFDYASSPETNTVAITERIKKTEKNPICLWSNDSQRFVTHRLDQRSVKVLTLLQNAPDNGHRPVSHDYRMSFSGDQDVPMVTLLVGHVDGKALTPLMTPPIPAPYLTPLEYGTIWWGECSNKLYFLREERGSKLLSLCVADVISGNTKTLIVESSETYIEPSSRFLWKPQVHISETKQCIIWYSEKSGYPHLYLHSLENGSELHQITMGNWGVRKLHVYDGESDWLYFSAAGVYQEIDPYYEQLFRCHLDGSGLECLTSENGHHTISISPDRKYFLDVYSTINAAPISTLKTIAGMTVSPIEIANLDVLHRLNWRPPSRIKTFSRDGKTPVYGNLYYPSNFDSTRSYPIIDHIYPGPQVYRTVPNFSLHSAIFRSPWVGQALAELGFIVLHMDGMGTPGRSTAFHRATYGNMGDCGIPDHVAAIQQLAEQFSFIDINRVGVTGYSGGGYAAARAMLLYPEIYKVGVAAAGNHDLRVYPASYGEKYNGMNSAGYEKQSNAALAHCLKGKLLLIHGEMDDNVHPCATLQLANALIKENKNFDMLIMPNMNHRSTFDHPYYWRRQWDYLITHLLGHQIDFEYQFGEIMPSNFPQFYDW